MTLNVLVNVFLLLSVVNATSWMSKEEERTYKIDRMERGPQTDWTKRNVICVDELTGCSNLKAVCKLNIVRRKCQDTCGVCRAAAPPDCKLTKYKCCWDNVTTAKGPNLKGCPPCADKYDECKVFKKDCDRPDIRTMCPVTCGIKCSDKQCADNKHQALVCPMYKKYGFCKVSPDLMLQMCSKTCGFCPS